MPNQYTSDGQDRFIPQIRRMKAEGMSMLAIGARLGLTKGQVSGILWRDIKSGGAAIPRSSHRSDAATDPKPPMVPVVREIVMAPKPMPVPQHTPISPTRQCQFPVGGETGPRSIRFECKATPMPGRPYCADHARICYQGFVWHQRHEHAA